MKIKTDGYTEEYTIISAPHNMWVARYYNKESGYDLSRVVGFLAIMDKGNNLDEPEVFLRPIPAGNGELEKIHTEVYYVGEKQECEKWIEEHKNKEKGD
jgi:hypothetical protein